MDKANHQTAEFINNVGVYNFLNGDVQRAIAAFNQAAQMGNEAAKANLQQLQQILNMKKNKSPVLGCSHPIKGCSYPDQRV